MILSLLPGLFPIEKRPIRGFPSTKIMTPFMRLPFRNLPRVRRDFEGGMHEYARSLRGRQQAYNLQLWQESGHQRWFCSWQCRIEHHSSKPVGVSQCSSIISLNQMVCCRSGRVGSDRNSISNFLSHAPGHLGLRESPGPLQSRTCSLSSGQAPSS